MSMDPWVLWVIAGVILAIGEISTLSLFLGPFALGAFAAAVASAAGAGAVLPWVLLLILSILVLLAVRPIARAHRQTPAQLRTGTAALVGQEGFVVESIEGPENVGRVKIAGEVWTARTLDGDPIEAGRHVHVVEIKGATALVME
jgi:membrane protein implicated in regulation of membrane protease activity